MTRPSDDHSSADALDLDRYLSWTPPECDVPVSAPYTAEVTRAWCGLMEGARTAECPNPLARLGEEACGMYRQQLAEQLFEMWASRLSGEALMLRIRALRNDGQLPEPCMRPTIDTADRTMTALCCRVVDAVRTADCPPPVKALPGRGCTLYRSFLAQRIADRLRSFAPTMGRRRQDWLPPAVPPGISSR